MGVEFEREDYLFLNELGIFFENLGCYGGGVWWVNGFIVMFVNLFDNKV